MNPKKKISLSFITVFLAICVVFSNAQNDTSELKWYSMPPDEIKLNIFQSPNKINPNSNPDYVEWVFIRDAFRYDYSEDNDTYVKLVDYFAPETDNYYKDKLDFAGLFIGCAVISFVCIIIYLIIRFVKKGCMGPKNKKGEEAYDKHKWSLVIIGGTIAFVSLIVTMAYSSRHPEVLDHLEESRSILSDVKADLQKRLESLSKTNVTSPTNPNQTFEISIPHIDEIYSDVENSYDRLGNLINDVKSYENPKFAAQTILIVFDFIFAALGILGYYFHKSWITWICQFCIFLSIPFFFFIIGFEASYMVVGIDFCQSTRIVMLSEIYKAKGQGIGEYITCPDTDSKRYMNTGIFKITTTYNEVYNQTIQVISDYSEYKDILDNTTKRDNQAFKWLIGNITNESWTGSDQEQETPEMKRMRTSCIKNLGALIDYNHILGDLKSLVNCQAAENAVNRIESSYCIDNFSNVGNEIISYLVSLLGLFILAIGLNKVILIIYRDEETKVLRGKKLFQEDALDEGIGDEEESDEDDRGRSIN